MTHTPMQQPAVPQPTHSQYPTQQYPQQATPKTVKPSHSWVWLVFAILVLGIVGVSGFIVYDRFFKKVEPGVAFLNMIEASREVDTVFVSGELHVFDLNSDLIAQTGGSFGVETPVVSDVFFTHSGPLNVNDQNIEESKGYAILGMNILDTNQDDVLDLELEYRQIGSEESYVSMKKFDVNFGDELIDSLAGTITPTIVGQWLRLDIGELIGEENQAALREFQDERDVIQEETTRKLQEYLTEENINAILEIYKETEPFTFEKVGDETLEDGIDTMHIKITIDQEKFLAFIDRVEEKIATEFDEQYEPISEEKRKEFLEFVQNGALQDNAIHMWIREDNNYVAQVRAEGSVKMEMGRDGLTQVAKYTYTLKFSQYNQPIEVEAPADSVGIENFIMELMGGIEMGMEENEDLIADAVIDRRYPEDPFVVCTLENQRLPEDSNDVFGLRPTLPLGCESDADNDGISNYFEVKTFLTDPENADTDGDGFDDLSELENGYNPLGEGERTFEQFRNYIDWTLLNAENKQI